MVNYYNECLDVAYGLMDEDPALEEWVSYRMNELADLKGNTDYAFTRLLYQMFTFDYFKEIIDTDLASGVADQRAIRNLAIMTNILSKFESIERVEVISSEKKIRILQKLFRTYFRFLMKGGMEEYQKHYQCAEERRNHRCKIWNRWHNAGSSASGYFALWYLFLRRSSSN